MKNLYNRILIATDLSEMDETLIAFTDQLIKETSRAKIYLLHVIPDFVFPTNPKLAFHRKFSEYPVDEKVKDTLKERLGNHFQDNVEIDVIEGQPYQKLLHWVEVKNIDVVVIGHKQKSQGSGITAKRLARQTSADVLLVAENAKTTIKNILVPVDYSDPSAAALKKAIAIKRRDRNSVKISVLHLVSFLPMDHFYGLNLNDEYRNSLIKNARDGFKGFLKQNEILESDVELIVQSNDSGSISNALHVYTQKNEPDLVIMGAQGHGAFERFLMGVVTEGFVNRCVEVPVLVVR